jgi:hypothetical protein
LGQGNSQEKAEVKKNFVAFCHKAVTDLKKCQKFTVFHDQNHRRLSFHDDKQTLLDPCNKFSICNGVLLTMIFSSAKM